MPITKVIIQSKFIALLVGSLKLYNILLNLHANVF